MGRSRTSSFVLITFHSFRFRQEYFSSFFSLLSFQAEVTDLRAIEEAYVPLLKMRFGGIEIDMTFAKLDVTEVSERGGRREGL